MATYHLTTPLQKKDLALLRSGDLVLLSGIIYSARDAAHKRIIDALEKGQKPPFELEGAAIYYMGPTPAPKGFAIGSAGPTTSYRMDAYAPKLYSLGLGASIGKGKRTPPVIDAMKKYTGVYLGATGGAGALISKCITASEVIAYEDLGAEAVRKLTVKDFPLLVINDSVGGELYVKPNFEF
ncbi:Fe-S-containing hydro-lyase [Desulfovibrio litoralis]|uniref:Fumarate hydratase subunit beta n=1 Tax=Desulfovibrio litoralis DSM 11393 TaxID=1121455 RepID=A0A1M7RQN5_9BACT|nr:Fe-S-containing hydro-lyase [Desulfovibrio litoralis]SHN48584.1 fumarate hydratase subunit beta [Desulfovibrio litoralis DSM 11393]